jgi:hypothetical protein
MGQGASDIKKNEVFTGIAAKAVLLSCEFLVAPPFVRAVNDDEPV